MKTFRPYDPDQLLQLPPSLSDWLPENHLARFVSDLVDTLDLTAIEATYDEERGFPPYHPRLMVKLLVYAYCTGTYSSRRIAGKLLDSVAFRFLAAENQPDFRTISDFRKRHGDALSELFVQVLRLCQQAGLVKLGRVAVDGTRIKANASKHKAMSYGRLNEREAQLKREIRRDPGRPRGPRLCESSNVPQNPARHKIHVARSRPGPVPRSSGHQGEAAQHVICAREYLHHKVAIAALPQRLFDPRRADRGRHKFVRSPEDRQRRSAERPPAWNGIIGPSPPVPAADCRPDRKAVGERACAPPRRAC